MFLADVVWVVWTFLGQGTLQPNHTGTTFWSYLQVPMSRAQSLTELSGKEGRNAATLLQGWGHSRTRAGPTLILTVKDFASTAWPCFPLLRGLAAECHPHFPRWLAVLWNTPFSHPTSPEGQSELFLMDLSLPLSPTKRESRALEYGIRCVSLPDYSGNRSPRVNTG